MPFARFVRVARALALTFVVVALRLASAAPAFATSDPPAAAAPAAPAAPTADSPPQMEAFQLVVLQRPEHPTEYPQARLDEIQREHLGHLMKMATAGKLVVAGPLGDQPDPRWRGLALYRVGNLDEARRLAEDDPAVKAGRLEVMVMTWYTQKGALAFPIGDALAGKKP